MNKSDVNENTVNPVKKPWYLSTWFIILVFFLTFIFTYGIPAAVLAIIRFVKYKENRKGSGVLMSIMVAIPTLLIVLLVVIVNQEGKADKLIKEGQYAEAQAYLDGKLSDSNDYIYYRQYADLYVAQGMYDQAVQKLIEYSELKNVCDWDNSFVEKLEECSEGASEQYKVLASNTIDIYNLYLNEKKEQEKTEMAEEQEKSKEVKETEIKAAKEEPEADKKKEDKKEAREQKKKKASQEKKNVEEEESKKNTKQEYIFSDSNTRYLSEEEIKDIDPNKLRIARNEIFARHGYIFQDEELQQYFSKMSWYIGTVPSEQFDMETTFNEYEKKNIELISQMEEGSNGGESKQDVKGQVSADAEDAPYLSNQYLRYYIEKNNIEVNTFPELEYIENYINNCKDKAVYVEKVNEFFKEPYYAMTREWTGLMYIGQMQNNKPDGIGALVKPINLSIGENDAGEPIADIYEYSSWSDEEDTYLARIYIGNFKEGRADGYGIEFSTPGDDDYYVSGINLKDYKKEQYQDAIFEMANPRRYEGGFKEGNYSGKGNEYAYMETYLYETDGESNDEETFDDEEYSELFGEEGQKVQEMLSGENKDILILSGIYEEGELNGKAKVYELGYLSYDGEMNRGEENGIGVEYFPCSEQIKYEGEWAYGKYNGTGTLYNEDGSVSYSGKWAHGDYAH